ncbi:MAG: hypothetical protein HOP11_01075 [Saprospiraceae bacterium]|nr:hypothetical protein [Saprospiraceae bacterium]
MKISYNLIVIALFSFLFLQSCRKDDFQNNQSLTTTSIDIATQQTLLESNETEINEQIESGLAGITTRSYPIRSWASKPGTYPNTLTIDYGPNGVVGPFGHIRSGKIIVQMSAPLKVFGAVRVVNHVNFYIDDIKIEGNVVLTNYGVNSQNQNVFKRDVNDRRLIFPNDKIIQWDGNQTLTQIEGSQTQTIIDDVWASTGSSFGINRADNDFEVNTIEPLIYVVGCPWIVEGVLEINSNNSTLSIDYGNGDCNSLALLTLSDGDKKEINLIRWW